MGQTLLDISRAWELAETSTSSKLVSKLPLLVGSLSSFDKSALGKQLVSAGRRFQSMGQYGQGELQKVSPLQNRKQWRRLSCSGYVCYWLPPELCLDCSHNIKDFVRKLQIICSK